MPWANQHSFYLNSGAGPALLNHPEYVYVRVRPSVAYILNRSASWVWCPRPHLEKLPVGFYANYTLTVYQDTVSFIDIVPVIV